MVANTASILSLSSLMSNHEWTLWKVTEGLLMADLGDCWYQKIKLIHSRFLAVSGSAHVGEVHSCNRPFAELINCQFLNQL